jgi:Tol biopolymer transport system component
VNTSFSDVFYPFFTGQRLYFNTSIDGHTKIYSSDYNASSDTFSMPVAVASINGPADTNDSTARVSPDGQTIFWTSNPAGGYGGDDIWMASWDPVSNDWTNVTNAGPKINTFMGEDSPSWNGSRNSH